MAPVTLRLCLELLIVSLLCLLSLLLSLHEKRGLHRLLLDVSGVTIGTSFRSFSFFPSRVKTIQMLYLTVADYPMH